MGDIQTDPKYHVLLIGIDSYTVRKLYGCVNDVDVFEKLLVGPRVGIPPEQIKRLTSPHAGTTHVTTAHEEAPATLANIRAALTDLGSEKVAAGNRVLIYYSGHGMRAPVAGAGGRVFHRESLVPVDFNASPGAHQLLFDFELNRLLAGIAARTRAVTVILDCCNSAGATREVPDRPDMLSRGLDPRSDLGGIAPLSLAPADAELAARGPRGMVGSVEDCHIVAACLGHELAREGKGGDGVTLGLLTRALVAALEAQPGPDLKQVPWGRIWQRMRAEVETENPWQHLWMAGSVARLAIAGPPAAGDMGLTITRTGPNAYSIEAGTLTSITKGATVAIYGERPALFPPLDSEDDRRARLPGALLRVTGSTLSTAVAEATRTPFDLPPGARGRLVRAGKPERLRCAIVPRDEAIAASLSASPLLEVVDVAHAHVRLEQRAGGAWELNDDIHLGTPGSFALVTFKPDQVDLARAVLEHYFFYALPLRMATLCKDLSGALQITLLACPRDRERVDPRDAENGKLPEVGTEGQFTYDLTAGDRVAFCVLNTSPRKLRVTLLCSGASGRVKLYDDPIVDEGASHVFWARAEAGRSYVMTVPAKATAGIDRMVAIGTTALGRDVRYLGSGVTFAEILSRRRAVAGYVDDPTSNPPAEQWTATQIVFRTRAAR